MSNSNTPNTETATIYGPLTGTLPVGMRASSSQAAVATTAATSTTPYGFSTSAQADAIVTLVNEIRASLVACGIIKGSA